jgi:NDP-sugar pyrophosphorylase family protein
VERALDELKKALCGEGERVEVDAPTMRSFAAACTVALAVGGYGTRLRSVTDALNVNKNAVRVGDGVTLIETTIRMYRDAGFADFVALVYHQAESIVELLGDGSHLGVAIRYSYDPAMPVGRGGAIRNALENGTIAPDRSLIVHNPDDVIVRYAGSFAADLVAAHLAGVRRGMVATAVMVEGKAAPYTGMLVKDGTVREVWPYPVVPIPAHVGVTVFAPAALASFGDVFDLRQKMDFEAVLFPILAAAGTLYTFFIPRRCWLQVNDPKALDELKAIFAGR